jgi:hypothetical protein
MIFTLVEAGYDTYTNIIQLPPKTVFDMWEFFNIRQEQRIAVEKHYINKAKNG